MSSAPRWLATLAQRLANEIVPIGAEPEFGCHYCFAEGQWEVTLFVGPVEIVGGPRDGERIDTPFFLSLLNVPSLFDDVREMAWQGTSLGEQDDVGPHIAIEAVYEGHPVWVRIAASAPAPFVPAHAAGLVPDPTEG